MERTIHNLTAQQLRRAAAIKDEIAELTKTLLEITGESQQVCAQVEDTSAKIRKPVGGKRRITAPIAPERPNTATELPAPTPEQVPDQAPKITNTPQPLPTTHVTDGLHPTSNNQPTVEQPQTPVVQVTEGQQQTTTGIATSTETGSNQQNLVSWVTAAVPAKWEIQRLLQEVARIITEHPEKIPALKTVGIPALTNEYLREAIEAVAKLNFTAEKRNASLWELGKNVTQDDAVLPAINQLGVRNLGDLLGKLNELGRYANKRGQILIMARIWSLAGVGAEAVNPEEPLVIPLRFSR